MSYSIAVENYCFCNLCLTLTWYVRNRVRHEEDYSRESSIVLQALNTAFDYLCLPGYSLYENLLYENGLLVAIKIIFNRTDNFYKTDSLLFLLMLKRIVISVLIFLLE